MPAPRTETEDTIHRAEPSIHPDVNLRYAGLKLAQDAPVEELKVNIFETS